MRQIPVHARNPGPFTGAGNWTWFLPGRTPTLVDAGSGEAAHLDEVECLLGAAGPLQVLVTHGHPDHASGATALAGRRPGTSFAKMPWPERDGRWPVGWRPLADGDIVPAGDTTLQVVHTPGHAPDHVCLWHPPSGTLFGGDLVIAGATVFIPGGPDGDLAAYLASIDRVLALQPSCILPAHGPRIDAPDVVLREALAHRHARERQIVDALRQGATSVDAVTASVYGPIAEGIRRLARETVTAHLVKLEREGRLRREGEAWHII